MQTFSFRTFISRYLFLNAMTALFYPLFMFLSYFVIRQNTSRFFTAFLILNILFIIIPMLIQKKNNGILERLLILAFLVIIPQAFSLFVFKPYGILQMLLSQIYAMLLFAYAYFKLNKDELSFSLVSSLIGLWFIILLSMFSSLLNVPKGIYEEYTTFSIITIIISIFTSNTIHIDSIINRKYRRLNTVSNNIPYINIFLAIFIVVAILLLFKFRHLAPIIANFIFQVILITVKIIKKILDFLSSLLGTSKSQQPAQDLNMLKEQLKPAKPSLITYILNIIGYVLAISIIGLLIYKSMGMVKILLKELINRLLSFLTAISEKTVIYDKGKNFIDTKSFIFVSSRKKSKAKKFVKEKINLKYIKDPNQRLRILFKAIISYYVKKEHYNINASHTPKEMVDTIVKGEVIYEDLLNQLAVDYNNVRYNYQNIQDTTSYQKFYENLK